MKELDMKIKGTESDYEETPGGENDTPTPKGAVTNIDRSFIPPQYSKHSFMKVQRRKNIGPMINMGFSSSSDEEEKKP